MNTRRMILAGMAGVAAAVAAGPFGATPARAEAGDFAEGTFVLGPKDAPITVTEFASMTCPHCARFTTDTFPEVKKRFIDTGKIRFIFRDFPLDGVALRASMLIRCTGPEKAEGLVDLVFRSQGAWARAADPVAALKQTMRLAGLGETQADACLADEALKMAVAQSRYSAEKDFQISSTPSFVIGSKVKSGEMTIDEFTQFLTENGVKP